MEDFIGTYDQAAEMQDAEDNVDLGAEIFEEFLLSYLGAKYTKGCINDKEVEAAAEKKMRLSLEFLMAHATEGMTARRLHDVIRTRERQDAV